MLSTDALPGTALTCLNGLKHGATSMALFIPGDEPQDFYNLLAESFETYQPANTDDAALVTDLALARWYLWRRQRACNQAEYQSYSAHEEHDILTEVDFQKLALFDRYCTQAERRLARALEKVQTIQKNALNAERWQAQHEMQKAKYDLDLQRFELRCEQAPLRDFANSSLPLRKIDPQPEASGATDRLFYASASQNGHLHHDSRGSDSERGTLRGCVNFATS